MDVSPKIEAEKGLTYFQTHLKAAVIGAGVAGAIVGALLGHFI